MSNRPKVRVMAQPQPGLALQMRLWAFGSIAALALLAGHDAHAQTAPETIMSHGFNEFG